MNETKKIALDLSNINKLYEKDVNQIRLLITDYFAAALAGYQQNKEFNENVEKVFYSENQLTESYVLLQNRKYDAKTAAFMNAIYGHGAELDDGNKQAAGHVGVHVIPAVFALADKLCSTNNDVLIAIATGYEAYIRISSAAQPGLVKRGYHSTGVVGTLACAAACARLFHLDSQGIEDAIALATTMTGGLLSYGDSRPAIKPLNPAKAAENGLLAAMLANTGIKGPSEALEGKNGWFKAVTDFVNEDYLEGSDHLLLHDCYFKLYPSCRHTHCVIDAAISLHNVIKIHSIKAIKIYIYPNAIKLAGIKMPKDQNETKFSIYYTFACALVNGCYGITDMISMKLTPEIISIINKIELIADESMENRKKGIRGTRIEITLEDNKVVQKTVSIPRGDPENPIEKKDIIRKLYTCAQDTINNDEIDKVLDAIDCINGKTKFINPISVIK